MKLKWETGLTWFKYQYLDLSRCLKTKQMLFSILKCDYG